MTEVDHAPAGLLSVTTGSLVSLAPAFSFRLAERAARNVQRWQGPELVDGLLACLDHGAPVLEKRRQRQAFAHRLERLVHGKARPIWGDIEFPAAKTADDRMTLMALLGEFADEGPVRDTLASPSAIAT